MNINFFIAFRYLFSRKKRNFINFISFLSAFGVCIGTMALVIVLSVFNGLEELMKSIYHSFDADLRVAPFEGKTIDTQNGKMVNYLTSKDEIEAVTEVLEDNALIKYKDQQAVVKVKALSSNYSRQYNIGQYVVQGKPILEENGLNFAILGRGVQYKLGVDVQNKFHMLQFYYPKQIDNVQFNPEKAFNNSLIYPGAVFALEQRYDEQYVLVPLKFGIELMNAANKRSYFEIKLKNLNNIDKVKNELKKQLGPNFQVLTREELHKSMLRAVKIEKLFMYVTFSIIMAISSLNIFFMLTMLALEKKHDMYILHSMGTQKVSINRIFLLVGVMIAGIGAVTGLGLGYMICYLQQTYGLVTMGSETSLVNAYPVKMTVIDFVMSGIIVFVVAIIISIQPASKAAKSAHIPS
ncbi:MAG: FtsX-like permease family protein [Bacteroidota bacterium]|nr:FtsX-like permease family protein [Bacteroidota bacterium]